MAKKKQTLPYYSLEGSVLASEIKHASAILLESTNWMLSLSEGLEFFTNHYSSIAEIMENLACEVAARPSSD